MTSRSLARRLERLEDNLLPATVDPIVLKIIFVSPDDDRVESGIGVQSTRSFEAVQEEMAMKAISWRLHRLEDQLVRVGKPRKTFRITLRPLSGKADLAKSTCYRTLCADGSVSESVALADGDNARPVIDNQVEDWITGFPIEVPDGTIRHRPLPRL